MPTGADSRLVTSSAINWRTISGLSAVVTNCVWGKAFTVASTSWRMEPAVTFWSRNWLKYPSFATLSSGAGPGAPNESRRYEMWFSLKSP